MQADQVVVASVQQQPLQHGCLVFLLKPFVNRVKRRLPFEEMLPWVAPRNWPDSCRRLPHGLLSLSEMVNLQIAALYSLSSQLMLEQIVRSGEDFSVSFPDGLISEQERTKMLGWMQVATAVADEFEMKAVHDRIKIIRKKLEKPIAQRNVAIELRVLRETINSSLTWQLIYRYSQEKNEVLTRWQNDWASVLKTFPSARDDVLAAVDLWSLGHSTACVFHLMRVLEHGLRALARDVGRTFDIQQWQNIIDEIKSEIEKLGKSLPRGTEKNQRLQFLSEAAKEFTYFKDGWRNYVSHGRGVYNDHQARSVMEHVRAFMTTLSSRLNERGSA
jgi:hypothetical protein